MTDLASIRSAELFSSSYLILMGEWVSYLTNTSLIQSLLLRGHSYSNGRTHPLIPRSLLHPAKRLDNVALRIVAGFQAKAKWAFMSMNGTMVSNSVQLVGKQELEGSPKRLPIQAP